MSGTDTGRRQAATTPTDAEHVLADAGRLAAAVLAEAENRAQEILRDAHATATWMLEEARAAVDDVLRPPDNLLRSLSQSEAS